LAEAAETADATVAEQLRKEVAYATALVNQGCSVNIDGDVCADDFVALGEAGCPAAQADVDGWVESFGCCVGSFVEIAAMNIELTAGTPCPGDFVIGKACKAPKWKLPKKEAPLAAPKAKKGVIAGAVLGGVAGLGLVGLALKKRRAKLSTAKPQKATGQVAMVSVPVAV
jgi:hypothetical protein